MAGDCESGPRFGLHCSDLAASRPDHQTTNNKQNSETSPLEELPRNSPDQSFPLHPEANCKDQLFGENKDIQLIYKDLRLKEQH